jgi:hypothetical protein
MLHYPLTLPARCSWDPILALGTALVEVSIHGLAERP